MNLTSLTRMRQSAVLLFIVALLLSPLAAVQPAPTPATAQPAAIPASETGRWVVQLQPLPLAQADQQQPALATLRGGSAGRLNAAAPLAQQYRASLVLQQQALFARIQQMYPSAQLERSYQIVVNGIAINLPGSTPADAAAIQRLPEVVAVYPDLSHQLQMFSSLEQIGAAALWNTPGIGGVENAGAGVKVAIVDSGINSNHPFFNPAGFTYPAGYPRGDERATTPKVIVARSYFRPAAPPLAGSESPLPGSFDSSHGTHVAGTAAGVANVPATVAGIETTVSGVAPRAYLMNYKAFYANDTSFSGSAFSVELVAALEDAVLDGADIINNSWGGRADVAPNFDLSTIAANAAADAGVVVVFAAGNDGPDFSTAGSPAYSDKLISVGAISKSSTIAAGFVDVVAPDNVPDTLTAQPFSIADFGPPLGFNNVIGPAPYLPIGSFDGTGLGCQPLPPGTYNGEIALIERGECEFSVKTFNAQNAGASGVIIFNSEVGGENLVRMAGGTNAENVTIPAVFVRRSTGLGMRDWVDQTGAFNAQVQIDTTARLVERSADVLAQFSSRGPSFQGTLKPDVVAPGSDILSAGFADDAAEPHSGFGFNSGTSMAAPHVAGAAALLRQLYPDWNTTDVKSALMSTANRTVWLDEAQTIPAGVLSQGAGRIDVLRAANPVLLFDRPSLSFVNVPQTEGQPTVATIAVGVRNITGETQTYSVTARPDPGNSFAVTTDPAELTLAPGEFTRFTVTIEVPANQPSADYAGVVELFGAQTLHIPIWARTLPAQPSATVLLIDNDASSTLELPDYSGYYGNALMELGVSFDYYDADAVTVNAVANDQPAPTQTIPGINDLLRYPVIIWFTGDNFVPPGGLNVLTPLTPEDQNLLIAYLQSGGNLIASGQNLAEASDIFLTAINPRFGRSDLYNGYLGATWESESVFLPEDQEELTIRPQLVQGIAPWLADRSIDLTIPNDGVAVGGATGAGNQRSVDSVSTESADLRLPDRFTTPIMQALDPIDGTPGYVALSRSANPTLENAEVALPYRSITLSFGLEGVRNDTGTLGRTELLQQLLWWITDRPTVTLDPPVANVSDAGQSVTFTANATSTTPTSFVRYRWDFGDGSPTVETTEPTVTHTYSLPGNYPVRVAATNQWGHSAVSPQTGPGIQNTDNLLDAPAQPDE